MNKIFRYLYFVLLCAVPCTAGAQHGIPMLGAQVIIEPGQTDAQIEGWFRILNQNGMKVCRIRMFEQYMHDTASGSWDFTLFDKAFAAAEKYDVRIFATLFPLDRNNAVSLGGFKLPSDEGHLARIEDYIARVVSHFSAFKSMYGWVLINEPGTGGWVPDSPYMAQRYREWCDTLARNPYKTAYPRLVNFDKQRFVTDCNTWYLGWLAARVREYDAHSEIHVNNHQLFENVAEYDFPAWRSFLTSLGTSAHPSWHFNYFERSRYAVALGANCEIIRSGAGELPFLITELQGGNNTYSGDKAFCPTSAEITQWLWTGIGTGAQGIVFWSLNPRSVGEEAGEWALVDFQERNTDRLDAVRDVAACLDRHGEFFRSAEAVRSPITILYDRESLWVESKAQGVNKNDPAYEGRNQGGVMKSTVAFYEVLAENGVKANIAEINEFGWSEPDYSGQCVVLANQVALPSRHWENLRRFVARGGMLLVEGLSAFYDENMQSLPNTGFPLADLFGGALREVVCCPGDEFGGLPCDMPVHLWKGYIDVREGTPLCGSGRTVTALRNRYGRGSVVWVPSLVGLGAVRTQHKAPLADFLRLELANQVSQTAFSFDGHHPGVIMQTLRRGAEYVTVIINKSAVVQRISIKAPGALRPVPIFPEGASALRGKKVVIGPDATLVLKWS